MKNKELLKEVAKDFGLEVSVNDIVNVKEVKNERFDRWSIEGEVNIIATTYIIRWFNNNEALTGVSFYNYKGYGKLINGKLVYENK